MGRGISVLCRQVGNTIQLGFRICDFNQHIWCPVSLPFSMTQYSYSCTHISQVDSLPCRQTQHTLLDLTNMTAVGNTASMVVQKSVHIESEVLMVVARRNTASPHSGHAFQGQGETVQLADRSTTIWPNIPPTLDYDKCGGFYGNQSTQRKPASVPLCPPQTSHDLIWAQTWAAATEASN